MSTPQPDANVDLELLRRRETVRADLTARGRDDMRRIIRRTHKWTARGRDPSIGIADVGITRRAHDQTSNRCPLGGKCTMQDAGAMP